MAQVQEQVATFDRRSTQRTRPATVAGLCYLAVIAGGLFAEGMVRGSLVVPGDAAATATAILENETLWRLGLAVHLLYLIPALAVNVIVSGLFRSMEPTLARLALVFGVAAVTVEAAALVYLYVPLAVIENGGSTLAALEAAPSLIFLATRLLATGFAVSLMIGVLTSMFTAIFISRNLLAIVGATALARWPRLFTPEPGPGRAAAAPTAPPAPSAPSEGGA